MINQSFFKLELHRLDQHESWKSDRSMFKHSKSSEYNKAFMNGHLYNKDISLIRPLEGATHRFCWEWVSIKRVLLTSWSGHYCLQPIVQFNLFCTSICSESTTVKLLLLNTSRFHRVFFAGSELPECKQFRILDCEHSYLVPLKWIPLHSEQSTKFDAVPSSTKICARDKALMKSIRDEHYNTKLMKRK